jgi:hypothetical protein
VFSYASEEQKLRYVRNFPPINDAFLSISIADASNETAFAAAQMVLNGKSLVIDVLVAERTAAFCSDDEDLMKTVAEHTDVCSRISNLTLAAGQATTGGNIKDNIEDMYRIKNDLETELSHQCAAFEQSFSSRLVSIDDISRTMAEGSALWELVKYMPFESSRDDNENTKEEAHYLAVVILSTGVTSLVDLGGASLIDSLVLECRSKIQEAGRGPNVCTLLLMEC